MAERSKAAVENASGSFFVDSSCIDCDTCGQLAPATFADSGLHSYVRVRRGLWNRWRAGLNREAAFDTPGRRSSQPPGCAAQHRSVILAAASAIHSHRLGEQKLKYGGFQWAKAARTAISD
jgi:hypothetical protein